MRRRHDGADPDFDEISLLTGVGPRIFENELFSDVTVKCGGREWKLHKIILCSRSEWFMKALTGSFQEAETGVVKIKDFDPEPVHWALRYLYSGSKSCRLGAFIS